MGRQRKSEREKMIQEMEGKGGMLEKGETERRDRRWDKSRRKDKEGGEVT